MEKLETKEKQQKRLRRHNGGSLYTKFANVWLQDFKPEIYSELHHAFAGIYKNL